MCENEWIIKRFDKNGDGTITIEELRSGLGHKENAETLIDLLKGADLDDSSYSGEDWGEIWISYGKISLICEI